MARFTQEQKQQFCELLAAGETVTAAARAVGHNRAYLYEAREADPEFARAWQHASEEYYDLIRAEIRRRGIGYDQEEEVWQGGLKVGTKKVRKASDVLLIFEAKAKMPEYRDQQKIEVEHNTTATVTVEDKTNYVNAVLEVLGQIGKLPAGAGHALAPVEAEARVVDEHDNG